MVIGQMVDTTLLWAYIGGMVAGTALAVVTFLAVRATWKLTRR